MHKANDLQVSADQNEQNLQIPSSGHLGSPMHVRSLTFEVALYNLHQISLVRYIVNTFAKTNALVDGFACKPIFSVYVISMTREQTLLRSSSFLSSQKIQCMLPKI
jgi:hypothetical protein